VSSLRSFLSCLFILSCLGFFLHQFVVHSASASYAPKITQLFVQKQPDLTVPVSARTANRTLLMCMSIFNSIVAVCLWIVFAFVFFCLFQLLLVILPSQW
jgi:hypothetical protein